MLRFDFKIIGILAAFYVLYLIITNKGKRRGLKEIGKSTIMYVYIMLVLKFTVFPIPRLNSNTYFLQKEIGFSRCNCIPLRSLYWALVKAYSYSMIMIILKPIIFNTCISIPFGFLIQLFYRDKTTPISKFWLALGFGTCIEGLQLLISIFIGYTYKVIDVDDVIFNAIGVLIGYQGYAAYNFIIGRLTTNSYQ